MGVLDFIKRRGRPPKQETQAKDWLEKIDRALKVRKQWWTEQRIDKGYGYYAGRQKPSKWTDEEWHTINLIYATINAELPSLYSDNPEFHVKLKRSFSPNPIDIAAYEIIGKLRASMLNYLKDELELRDVIRQMVFDSFFAYGVVKIYAEVEEEENPEAGEIMIEDGVQLLDEDGAPMLEPETIVENEGYKVVHLHPSDFLVDEDAGPVEVHDVNWKAHIIKRTIDEVRSDEKYDKKARQSVKATQMSAAQDDREKRKKGFLNGSSDKEADIVVVYEVYDLKKGEWLTVAEGCSDYLRAPAEIPDGIDGDPFVTLRLNLAEDSWYPVSHVNQLLDSQTEYNEIRSYQMRHRKNVSARVYALSATAYDDPQQAADALALGEDGTVITHEREVGYTPIQPVKDAPLDQSINIELAYLKADFSELAIGSNQRGSGAGIDSATEAGIIERRQQVREGDRRALVARAIQQVGRKLDQLIQATIDTEQVIRITGPQGAMWQVISPEFYDDERIRGEFEYAVDYSPALPNLPEIERAQLMQFITTLASFPHIMLSQALMKKMAGLFGITDDATVAEITQIGQQIMAGQLPPSTNGGSPPGPGAQPAQAAAGQAMGAANMMGPGSMRGGQ